MLTSWQKLQIEGWENRSIQEILSEFRSRLGEKIDPPLPIRLTSNGIIRPEDFFILIKVYLSKKKKLVLNVLPINSKKEDGLLKPKSIIVTPGLTVQFPKLAHKQSR